MKSLWETRDYGIWGGTVRRFNFRFPWVIQADTVVLNADFSEYIGLWGKHQSNPLSFYEPATQSQSLVDLTGDLRHIM